MEKKFQVKEADQFTRGRLTRDAKKHARFSRVDFFCRLKRTSTPQAMHRRDGSENRCGRGRARLGGVRRGCGFIRQCGWSGHRGGGFQRCHIEAHSRAFGGRNIGCGRRSGAITSPDNQTAPDNDRRDNPLRGQHRKYHRHKIPWLGVHHGGWCILQLVKTEKEHAKQRTADLH